MDYEKSAAEFVELLGEMRRISAKEQALEFSRGANGILFYLQFQHDGATAGELREAFQIGSGGVANALKDLERKGMILRSGSQKDKRLVHVFITEPGRTYISKVYSQMMGKMQHFLMDIGEEDAKALFRVLHHLVDSHKNM